MTINIAEFKLEAQIQTSDGGLEIVEVDMRGPVFCTKSYNQNALGFKGDGIWRDSPLAPFRELADAKHANVIDTMTMDINGGDPDAASEAEARLFRLCTMAIYYAKGWSPFPVWIKLRPAHMSEAQYSIFHMFRLPRTVDPFVGPFVPNGDSITTIKDFELSVEHGAWQDRRPIDRGDCVPLAGYDARCYPCHTEFDGVGNRILILDNVLIQDLHGGTMTVDGWIRPELGAEDSNAHIARKGPGGVNGWLFSLAGGDVGPITLFAQINCAVTNAMAESQTTLTPGEHVHVAFVWDDATYMYPRLFIAGEEVPLASTTNRNGVIDTDVGHDLYIGNRAALDRTFKGGISWLRISNGIRYNKRFTPPPRCALPEDDPSTVGLWIGAECTGAYPYVIDNMEGTAALDGSFNGQFLCDCGRYMGTVLPFCGPGFLEFNGVSSIISCGSDPSIDDLPDFAVAGKGVIVIDGWIRADSFGEASAGIIAWKVEWRFELNVAEGLRARIDCAGGNAISSSGLDEFSPDSTWHHVLAVYDEQGLITPAARTIYLAIDGEWVVSYPTQTVSAGNYVSDAAQTMEIGNRAGSDRTFDGDIAWLRLRNALPAGVVVGVKFDYPERCEVPAADGNTVLLEIWEGFGAMTYDLSGNRNDGAIDLATWGCDCLDDEESTDRYGELDIDPTCEREVFLANKWTGRSNITHVYWYDSSLALFGPNLAEAAPPFELLPDPVGNNDCLYICSSTASVHGGPFWSAVFDLLAVIGDNTAGLWEYWNGGAWAGLRTADNTDRLNALGENSIHWGPQTAAWATTTQNGVTGWWIRFKIVNSGLVSDIPVQQNNAIYSIAWPWVEVAEDRISGDIPALAEDLFFTISDAGPISDPDSDINRVVMGLRSMRRGPTFRPAINLGTNIFTGYATGVYDFDGPQLPPGWKIGNRSNVTFVAQYLSVTGYYANVAAGVVAASVGYRISPDVVSDYVGKYHVYVRVYQPTGVAADYGVSVSFVMGTGGFSSTTKTAYTQSNDDFEVLDLGQLLVGSPDIMLPSDIGDEGLMQVDIVGEATGTGLRLYDVWIIPMDEWGADIVDVSNNGASMVGSLNGEERYIQIEGTMRTKRKRALVREIVDDDVASVYLMQSVARPMWQARTMQRLHAFWMKYGTNDVWVAPPWIAFSSQSFAVQRYNLLRGSE